MPKCDQICRPGETRKRLSKTHSSLIISISVFLLTLLLCPAVNSDVIEGLSSVSFSVWSLEGARRVFSYFSNLSLQ